MRYAKATLGFAGCLCVLSGSVLAQTLRDQERVVASGHRQKIGWHVYIDPACHSMGAGSVGVVEPPRLGRITVQHGQEYPAYPSNNPRSRCNVRKVPATQLIYSTAPGAVGEDMFEMEYIGLMGNPTRQRFHIVVR